MIRDTLILPIILALSMTTIAQAQIASNPETASCESDKINLEVNITSEDDALEAIGIDLAAFPKVKLSIFIDELSALEGRLTKEDFLIQENGTDTVVDNFYFTGNASGKKLDLAVVFDDTETMDDQIRALQLKVNDLTEKIEYSKLDARYCLVTFKGNVTTRINWTADANSFSREVIKLHALDGNNNLPECSLDGIERALSFGFRPDAQKVLMIVTDEPSHQKGDGTSNSTYSMEDVKRDLLDAGVILIAVSPDFLDPGVNPNVPSSDLPRYADMRDLAEATSGMWIDMNSDDFSAILEWLKGLLTGTYVLEYTSPDETHSDLRSIAISVDSSDCTAGPVFEFYITPGRAENSAESNDPPTITDLTSDKASPQLVGAEITWDTSSTDPDEDQMLYRFVLNDVPMTDWMEDDSWTWKTSEADIGSSRVEVQIRDGRHAGQNGLDDHKAVNFEVVPINAKPVIDSLKADILSPQDSGASINWTACATDPDGDEILYRYFLNGEPITDWTADGTWTWATTETDVGSSQIEVRIRDGMHAGPDGSDDWKSESFEITELVTARYWMRTFGGSDLDAGISVQQTRDGGYIVTGGTSSLGFGGKDIWLIKTDSNGTRLWHTTFGGPNEDTGLFVQQTSDDGYVVIGGTLSYGSGGQDIWLIKTDSSGRKEWDKTFGGPNDDVGRSIQQTSDGGYIITGWTFSLDPRVTNLWLIKTDANGDKIWDRAFGGHGDVGRSIQQTGDGDEVITGWTFSLSSGDADIDQISTAQQTKDGGYIVIDRAYPQDSNAQDLRLIKTDSSGRMEWNRTFGGSSDDVGASIQQTDDDGYIITGYTRSSGAGEEDLWLVKTDSSGHVLWERTFGGSDIDEGFSAQQTEDGGYVVTGYTRSFGSGDGDLWLLKTDPNGDVG